MYGSDPDEQEALRKELVQTIVRMYYMREIGYETYELWKLQLQTRLRTIMPKYIQLYKTTLFDIDLENPYHLITEHKQSTDTQRNIQRSGSRDNVTTTSNITDYDETIIDQGSSGEKAHSSDKTVNSDFPQASGQNGNYASSSTESTHDASSDIESSSSRKHTGDDSQTGKGTSDEKWEDNTGDVLNDIMNYIHDVKGHTSNLEIIEAIERWRDLIININQMIADELADLFMQIY